MRSAGLSEIARRGRAKAARRPLDYNIDSCTATVYYAVVSQSERVMNMQALSDRSGTPVRTIRFYISQRLLAGPQGRGTSSSYAEDHLRRLLLIKQLTRRHVPLTEIRDHLDGVSPEALAQVLELAQKQNAAEAKVQKNSPRQYLSELLRDVHLHRMGSELGKPYVPQREDRDVWRRVKVASGIELHYTLESEERNAELVAELIDSTRQVAQRASTRRGT